ncbi:MAG: hypothetical protein NZ696_00070 [Thermomicrobium sp.]|nr:hypothetical protein [Thermomicrobium sp.]MDW7981667.1 hypothetical protein [Thermomicrobium sp.]
MVSATKAAILRYWELEHLSLPTLDRLPLWARRGAWGCVLDGLLEAIATTPDFPAPYLALALFNLLQDRPQQARLLWRSIQRRNALEPNWSGPTESSALSWLLDPDLDSLPDLGQRLLAGLAPVRRAFLPLVVHRLAENGARAVARELAAEWFARFPLEPESWWCLATLALETPDEGLLHHLLTAPPPSSELPTPWQRATALKLAAAAPEPLCWSMLHAVLEPLRRNAIEPSEVRHLKSLAATEYLHKPSPRTLLLALLVGDDSVDLAPLAQHLLSVPTPHSPVERHLVALLAVRWIPPTSVTPEIETLLLELFASIAAAEKSTEVARALLPTIEPLSIVEYALCVSSERLSQRALSLLHALQPTLPELLELAHRLDLVGHTRAAIQVARLAAQLCRLRNDRPGLLRTLRALVQLDPHDREALEFLVTTDTRAGQPTRAIDTLLATAQRAASRGDRAAERMLLERAAALAELADDRTRLALVAEMLAETDPTNPARHIAAATALLRAGQPDRARHQLWTAIQTALQARRLDEALVAAEQLAALDPADAAARAQLEDLRALHRRLTARTETVP